MDKSRSVIAGLVFFVAVGFVSSAHGQGTFASAKTDVDSTNTWTTESKISALVSPREWHTATLLNDGHSILFAGGQENVTSGTGAWTYMSTAELDNQDAVSPVLPITEFGYPAYPTQTGMSSAHSQASAALTTSNTVLIMGGYNASGADTQVSDLFTP